MKHHANVNVNLVVESVMQITNRIMINVDMGVKEIIYVILLHAVVKIVII